VRFKKGDCKEDIARKYLQRAEQEGRFGVVLIGVAQEKTSAWRGWRGGPDGHPHFEYRRQSIFPNNYYFYILDPEWGPAFIKTIAYAPFPVWVYLNGHHNPKVAGSNPAPLLKKGPVTGYGPFLMPRSLLSGQ
jgi:hypothetical protein